jgi:hypothetical protein
MDGTGKIILREVSQVQKVKSCMFSYVEYRLKTNAAMLWDSDHTKGRPWTEAIGQGKEIKNLNVVDVLSVQE